MTKDGGATWTPLHGNGSGFDLPNVRTYVVRFDPSDPTDQTLYAGTDLGFYRSTDLGQTWTRYGSNLPLVRVQDLFVSMNGSLIREGCVDELLVYLAPCLLGDAMGMFALAPPERLDQKHTLKFYEVKQVGEDLRILARFTKPEE